LKYKIYKIMEELKIVLSLDEVNLVLNALGEQSFKSVSQAIQKIMAQAESQLKANQAKLVADKQPEAKQAIPETKIG